MLYIHKKSSAPIDPWPALRHGGVNNLDHKDVIGKYLVLFSVDILHREGFWHYIMLFDVRETLAKSALAQLAVKEQSYSDDMDWKEWLGPDFNVISASVREEILNMPEEHAHTGAVITGMRELPGLGPIPGRKPEDWFDVDLPEEFLIAPPGGV
jgi:hypothetical protein